MEESDAMVTADEMLVDGGLDSDAINSDDGIKRRKTRESFESNSRCFS